MIYLIKTRLDTRFTCVSISINITIQKCMTETADALPIQTKPRRGRSGGRKARTAARQEEEKQASKSAPAYVKREIPFYDFLSEEALVRIEDHADWLMQEIGIEFRDDPGALDIWREAGADVDGMRVRLPKGMARELCKTIPSQFTQHARNPQYNVEIGGANAVFSPVHCARC